MLEEARISCIDPADPLLDDLAVEANAQGYEFVDRLLSEARSGVNRFDKDGELFCGAFLAGKLVACGGVNIDPYSDEYVGRLRHVYVLNEARRTGIATALVRYLLDTSRSSFTAIRLRTSDAHADRFYEAIGFSPTTHEKATHIIRL